TPMVIDPDAPVTGTQPVVRVAAITHQRQVLELAGAGARQVSQDEDQGRINRNPLRPGTLILLNHLLVIPVCAVELVEQTLVTVEQPFAAVGQPAEPPGYDQ